MKAHKRLKLALPMAMLSAALFCTVDVRGAVSVAEPDMRRDATVTAIERVMPAVVNIGTKTKREQRGYAYDWFRDAWTPYSQSLPPSESAGSGVIIDEDGYVLTNAHVVEGADEIWVRVGDKIYQATLIIGTRATDIAVLRLKAKPGEKFTAVRFGADDDLLLGETVVALGNPFGLGASVSRGILSAKSRRAGSDTDVPLAVPDWLQTDAAINPGNSGGPLINLRGEVIGINVAVYRDANRSAQGIGFAIPIKRVNEALSELFTPEELGGLWFGARVKAGSLPLVISSVQQDSPAEKAGLKQGDLVLRIDGKTQRNFIEFGRDLVVAGTNRDIPIFVRRGGEARDLSVRLIPETVFFNPTLIQKRTGMSLQPLTTELAQRLGLNFYGGFVVAGVEKGSPAATVGLQEYAIIRTVEGQSVGDLVSLAKYLYSKPKGEQLKLDLVYLEQRGAYRSVKQGTVSLTLR
ncbi:MAG TPA: trypsin-like peptidase domain-containing protein [Roseimicrobium sp.]|nr:trypsin-like peptidase domain-containing protein [Roseimicrobium sp.]